jgi:hypothetical protein
MTGLSFDGTPTSRDDQSTFYDAYHGGPGVIGAVIVQPCGFISTSPLWPGATSDSKWMRNSGILEKLSAHAQSDSVDSAGRTLPSYTITTDKGFRNHLDAARQNMSLVSPSFATEGTSFSKANVIRIASIARIRSGNERAVRVVKLFPHFQRKIPLSSNLATLSNMWVIAGFRSNFLYNNVMGAL